MQIGEGIKSSYAPGSVGTLGVFLSGNFFGHAGIALLTNSHVIGEKMTSKAVWEELLKVWKALNPAMTSPATQRKTLYEKLGVLLDSHRKGALADNPPRSVLLPAAPKATDPIFQGTNGTMKLTDLFCTITNEGDVAIADAIWQPQIGNDYAVALLRTGVAYDNRARKGDKDTDSVAIAKTGEPKDGMVVYKFGHTSGFKKSTVTRVASPMFYVKGTEHVNAFYKGYNGFSAKGDSGSAVFNSDDAWLGLLYAGGTAGEGGAMETKCYLAATIMAALGRSFGEGIKLAGSGTA